MTEERNGKKEEDVSMQEVILKTIGKAANSPAEVILKYIVIGVLTLFGTVVWYTWQSNMAQPDRLYSLLERSIEQQEKQTVAQTEALREIQRFTVAVGIEHQDHATKLALHESANGKRMDALAGEIKELCEGNKLLVNAIQENTAAVSRWIEQMEQQNP
jgi:hypothetical protein